MQAVDVILERMKEANFNFGNIVAVSGTAQVVNSLTIVTVSASGNIIKMLY